MLQFMLAPSVHQFESTLVLSSPVKSHVCEGRYIANILPMFKKDEQPGFLAASRSSALPFTRWEYSDS